jgi:GNAT superfamily N-acetyltransferase
MKKQLTLITMQIRKTRKTDLPAIIEMLANDTLGAKRETFDNPLPECYYDAWEKIQKDPNQKLMTLEHNKQVIGTFQMTFIPSLTYQGGTRAQIEGVRIREDYTGRGFGQKVFEWAIEESKRIGAHVMQLTTDKQRPDAIRFYEKLGFVASHEGMKLHFILK